MESELATVGPEEFEGLVRTLGLDRLELISLMGYELHLEPTETLYGPLVAYLSRRSREQQRKLLEVLDPSEAAPQ